MSQANNDEVIRKLIDGHSLFSYMTPDDSLPTNRPLHSEGFYLPHIIITGDVFWGMSRTVHFYHRHGSKMSGIAHFGYTNHCKNLFFGYTPTTYEHSFMSLKRYKNHIFVVKDNWKLIWDSKLNNKQQNKRLNDYIKQGLQFKIAMLDSENIWNIHPVDLPMYNINEETFNVKSEFFDYPGIIRNSEAIDTMAEANKTFFSRKPESNKDGILYSKCMPFRAFYNLSDNGRYYNYYDIPRRSKQNYKRLRIFCEKETGI